MPDPIYPPKRPNMAHFAKTSQNPAIGEDTRAKLSAASVEALKSTAKRKRHGKPKT